MLLTPGFAVSRGRRGGTRLRVRLENPTHLAGGRGQTFISVPPKFLVVGAHNISRTGLRSLSTVDGSDQRSWDVRGDGDIVVVESGRDGVEDRAFRLLGGPILKDDGISSSGHRAQI